MPRFVACTTGLEPSVQARVFEDRLMTRFAINPSCKGAAFARYDGPNGKTPSVSDRSVLDRPHWTLIIDFVVGASTQFWSLQYNNKGQLLQGESMTEARMASDVCAIVMGKGGAVVR